MNTPISRPRKFLNWKILSLAISLAFSLSLTGCSEENKKQTQPSPSLIEQLKNSADGGDAKAQIELAGKYEKGNGVEKSQKKAFDYLLKAANNGSTEAMIKVSERYGKGLGVPKDESNRKKWLKAAASAGDAEANYRMANTYGLVARRAVWIWGENETEKINNAKLFVEHLEKAIKLGHSEAAFSLGMTKMIGATEIIGNKRYIAPTPETGVVLLTQAAEKNHWQAQWALGVLYQSGLGSIKQNSELSKKWWDALDAQTDDKIQTAIGHHYHEFNSKYYNNPHKYRNRSLTFKETNKLAEDWYQKAAAQGNPDAMFSLGNIYINGLLGFKDQKKGLEFMRDAAAKGHVGAKVKLARGYLTGEGIEKDYEVGFQLALAAATDEENSTSEAHNLLAVIYEIGRGTDVDLVLAYAWYNIASRSEFDEKSKLARTRVERRLNADQIKEAQALSRNWQPGETISRTASSTTTTNEGGKRSESAQGIGTGFYITDQGHIITNNHVIAKCPKIRIAGEDKIAQLIVADEANDLALLKADIKPRFHASIKKNASLQQGEEILVFGFPLDGFLPSSGNVTSGIIASLSGPGNNASLIQISAPVQQGNSGGPVLNKQGEIVGVVVGKADAIKIARVTGDIPQNINFAISLSTLRAFLDGHQIKYNSSFSLPWPEKDTAKLTETARAISLKVECWR